jgi:hypothetical protein
MSLSVVDALRRHFRSSFLLKKPWAPAPLKLLYLHPLIPNLMSPKRALILLLIFSCGIIGLLHAEVLYRLNDVLFHVEGDGLKNYFNFLYHIKWDHHYSSFDGMNHPYGETIFMVDAHPVYVNLLKFFSENIHDLSPYAVGILNLTMLTSVPLAALFLFFIFRKYGVSPFLSTVGAMGIAFLSSNALLWQYGHYALSYACFFPIAWYLLLRFHDSEHRGRWSVLILIHTLFWFYIHTYLGLIILGFNAIVLVVYFILSKRPLREMVAALLLQVIIPIAFVYTVIRINDHHPGRIEMPFRTEYSGSLYTVFFTQNTFAHGLYRSVFDLTPMKTRSWSLVGTYIGLSVNLVLIALALYFFVRIVKDRRWPLKRMGNFEWATLAASVVLLLFSMAIPFKYGLEFLMPGLLKQFIGLGRFGWPFYFVITTYALIATLRFLPKRSGTIVFTLAALLLMAEGISLHLSLSKAISKSENLFRSHAEALKGVQGFESIDFGEYQAVLPLPYYHKYVSLHSFRGSLASEQLSMSLALETGLPLMSAILSRPSVSESKRIMEVFLPPNFAKPLISDLSQKPLLLLHTGEKIGSLEANLVDRAELILEMDTVRLFRLSIDSLSFSDTEPVADFLRFPERFTRIEGTEHHAIEPVKLRYVAFDDAKSSRTYRGKGAKELEKKEFHVIFKSEPGELELNVDYEFSFWYYNHLYDQSFNTCWVDVKNAADSITFNHYFDPVTSNIFDGPWHLNRVNFRLENEGDYVLLCSKGIALFADTVYFDELLVRPTHADVYRAIPDRGTVIKNNIEYPVSGKISLPLKETERE